MESSVDFGGAFDLWKALLQKMGIATRTPRKCEFSGVFFHPYQSVAMRLFVSLPSSDSTCKG